jgi:hypothetical protein
MDNIYNQYCPHGNPIYYSLCPACLEDKQRKQQARCESYYTKKHISFMRYFTDTFSFTNPSIQSPNVVRVRNNDKFYGLKKSNSQEQLRKEYYKLAKKLHPDKPSGSTKLFQKLQQIYQLLLRQYI